MATDGHPFYTESLDTRRAKHRRLLAGLPDRWVVDCSIVRVVDEPTTAEGFAETELRHLADKLEASDGVATVLTDPGTDARRGVRQLLSSSEGGRAHRNWAINDVIVGSYNVGEDRTEEMAPGVFNVVQAWIFVVTLADECAGDYRDRRVSVS